MSTARGNKDIYKDTPLRYLGYANEVGEALRGFIGAKLVHVSYGIATLYVVADTADKTVNTYQVKHNNGTTKCVQKTLFVATDTLIWQMLASVILPGYTINRICAFSNYLLVKNAKLPKNQRQLMVTCIGLGIIPIIIQPIDNLVHILLDHSFRKVAP